MIEVIVSHNDALRALGGLRKTAQHEGIIAKAKKKYHEKKSEERARKKAERGKRKHPREFRR